MHQVKIRCKATQTAFQWDGEYVEGFRRVGPYLCCLDGDGRQGFAAPGDWIVEGVLGGHFVWPQKDFDATYEVVSE